MAFYHTSWLYDVCPCKTTKQINLVTRYLSVVLFHDVVAAIGIRVVQSTGAALQLCGAAPASEPFVQNGSCVDAGGDIVLCLAVLGFFVPLAVRLVRIDGVMLNIDRT